MLVYYNDDRSNTRPVLPSVYVNALENTNATLTTAHINYVFQEKYVLAASCNSIPIISIIFCILFSIISYSQETYVYGETQH